MSLTSAQVRYRAYLQTPHWQHMRRRVLIRAENHCEQCQYFCGDVEVLANWAIDDRVSELKSQEIEPCPVCQRYCQFRSEDDNSGRVWLEVHHLTYERVGRERDTDLIALCCYCHEEISDRQQHRAMVRRLIPGVPRDARHADVLLAHLAFLAAHSSVWE